MATRDILDYQGNIIGQLTLPDNTTEQQWENALSPYAQPPLSMPQIIWNKLTQYEECATELVRTLKRDNTLAGITTAQSAQMFDDFSDVLIMLKEGAFPTAIYRLQQKSASGFVTQDMINNWILLIQSYL